MLCCDIIEDEEAVIARFYGGLRGEIQDIVDYKEYNSVPRLFQLASRKRIIETTTEIKEQFWKHDHFKINTGTSQNSPTFSYMVCYPILEYGAFRSTFGTITRSRGKQIC